MGKILEAYPGARRALFRKYHIGGCASCGFSNTESLADVCARSGGVDPGAALAWIAACDEEDRALQIEPATLFELLQQADPPRVVDIRTREEHETVAVPGSVFFDQILMQEILSSWSKDGLFVVYDHKGLRSLDAAAYFAGQGFTNVRSLRGGIDAWALETDPAMPRYELESVAT